MIDLVYVFIFKDKIPSKSFLKDLVDSLNCKITKESEYYYIVEGNVKNIESLVNKINN